MDRRAWLRNSGYLGIGMIMSKYIQANDYKFDHSSLVYPGTDGFIKSDFGSDFKWGVAAAAYQTEGAWNLDGKGESNWDYFSRKKGKIERGENADVSADFYHRYEEDIDLIKSMNFKVFRFSLSWSRILPKGIGEVNQNGLDFYHRVIDKCLEVGIEPWVTIYHWDMPQVLEAQGGWTNRKIVDWFSEYADVVTKAFGSKVKNWMVINEQLSFTGAGYMMGIMPPGEKKLKSFMKAVHHSVICNAEGGRIIRRNVPDANVGTTFVTTYVEPVDQSPKNIAAAERTDAVMNRLFIEPTLGLGYPVDVMPFLNKLKKYYVEGDEQRMIFDFDFIGIQYYFRTVVKKSMMPGLRAKEIMASERGVPTNEMEGEIYPEGLYHIIKKFSKYKGIRKLLITENGTCVSDVLDNGRVHDEKRIAYFKDHLAAILKAKKEGAEVKGYFVWSPTDNFEWDKGYRTRFGLVYIDFNTLKRTVKDSGLWFREFLK
jgi:beta-glucosidase